MNNEYKINIKTDSRNKQKNNNLFSSQTDILKCTFEIKKIKTKTKSKNKRTTKNQLQVIQRLNSIF